MKKLMHLLIVGTVLGAFAPLALASSITGSLGIAGSDTFTSNGVDFTSPGVVISASGSLAGFAFQPVTLDSFSFNSSADGETLFTIVGTSRSLLTSPTSHLAERTARWVFRMRRWRVLAS